MLSLNSLISPVFAEDLTIPIGEQVQSTNFFGYTCIKQLVFNLATAALTISGLMAIVFLVWGGLEWITSGGDKNHVESAKTKITSSLVGLAIVATSWAIYQVVLYFLGIDISNICSTNPF